MLSTSTLRAPARSLFQPSICPLWLIGGLLLFLGLSFSSYEVVRAQGSPGALSFIQSNYSVNEGDGSALITLTRTGGTVGQVSAQVTLTDVTTSSADYVFKPGALDSTFAQVPEALNSFLYYSQEIALQPDGKVLIGTAGVIRVNPDGSHDSSFNVPTLNASISAIAVQPNGKIIITGGFTTIGGVRKNGVARLNSDGSLDGTFDVGVGSTDAHVIALQSDGKILIGGVFSSFNLAPNSDYVVRLNSDGSVDSTFIKGANVSTTYALAVQPDGKILMGGLGVPSVVRLNQDGSADPSFVCNLANPVLAIALQPDGKIFAGGGFHNAGAQPIYNLARLNPNGSLDSTFNTGSGPDQAVESIVLQPDGKVIIGGDFASFNGTPDVNIARLNSDGSLDPTFTSSVSAGSGNFIHSILFQLDGKVMVGGSFTATGANFNRQRVARFNGDLFVTWPDGDATNKTIKLPIVDDLLAEPDETLALTLTPLTGGATAGAITNASLTIVDNDVPPTITSAAPPQGITRIPYSHTFTATGTPNPTFSLSSGTLPPGLFIQSSGLLSGTPTTAGTFSNITVTATNGVAPPATQTFSITILSGGTLQFSSLTYSVAENAGTAVITVTRAGGSAGATTVNFNTFGASATAGSDFTPVSGTLSFADGETSKSFSVSIINDNLDEPDEIVNLFLGAVTGSGTLGTPSAATLTIVDDDPPPSMSINDVSILEGDSGANTLIFTVTLSAPSGFSITCSFSTAAGTATAGSDYVTTSGTLFFNQGSTTRTISVTIIGDTINEPDETLFVNLSNPVNAMISKAQGTGTILNDDGPILLTEENTDHAIALDSVTRTRDPFSLINPFNLSTDHRTRVSLFVWRLGLLPSDTASNVNVLAEDDAGKIYSLTVEYMGGMSNLNGVTQVIVRLPDDVIGAPRNLWLTVQLRGPGSNKALIKIAAP